jgi:hypothetical protein
MTRVAAFVAVGAAIGQLVFITVRAVVRGYTPMGDSAGFATKAMDVLTAHNPQLGGWSSGSESVGVLVNSPGPLQYDLLALPIKLDWHAGTAIGFGVVGVLAVLGIALAANRVAGPLGTVAAMTVTVAMCWAMGSEVLIDARPHHSLLLPFLLFLVLVWALGSGDLAVMPWAAGVGSLVLQSHLTYAVLVPPLALFALVTVVYTLLRAHRADPDAWPARRRTAVRWTVISLAVWLLCWLQPLGQQLFGEGTGNMSAMVEAAGADSPSLGALGGARAVATVVALPTWWLRPSFQDFDPAAGLGGSPASLGALVALAALLSVLGLRSWRRRDRVALVAVAAAGVALMTGWLAASSVPTSGSLGPVSGNYRWLWPIGAFVALAIAVAALRGRAPNVTRAWTVVGALVATILALLNLPTAYHSPVLAHDTPLMEVARDLGSQLEEVEDAGTVLVDRSEGLYFGEPFSYTVIAEMADKGVPFVFDREIEIRRFGEGRRLRGQADAVLTFATGDGVRVTPAGATRIAFASTLDSREQRELEALREQPGLTSEQRSRYEELERKWTTGTVAVFIRPTGERTGG